MSQIKKVKEIVTKECPNKTWKRHINLVAKYAKLLAERLRVDEEIVELGALLHDIGSIKFGEENHEITGQAEAEKILKKLGYDQGVIEEVKECIRSHRGSKDVKPRTIVAEIIANADAMAHFVSIPTLFRVGLERNGNNEEKAANWILEKLERDWNKKLTIRKAKELMKERYTAIKLLLSKT